MTSDPLYVTRPFLPPLAEFVSYLDEIWRSGTLTNAGPLHNRLEEELADYLDVDHVVLFNNGTIALVTAIQAMNLTGEVVTTPYSFVATAHAISWNNLTPVFVDIDPQTLNIDPDQIEAAITEKTSAIVAVHCYGNPCAVERIEDIAKRHNLCVIYDAAHAFGVTYKGESLLRWGHLSVLSFHATKVFNTFEGGAIICHDEETRNKLIQLRNFGISGETTVDAIGLNGKMSEVQAAMGLLQLRHLDEALSSRQAIALQYREALARLDGIRCVDSVAETAPNYSYFPVLVDAPYPLARDEVYAKLKACGIFARRYFYPLISNMSAYSELAKARGHELPVAAHAADTVLCLPIYPGLDRTSVNRVIDALASR